MKHKPPAMGRIDTMLVKQELDPQALEGLDAWGTYEGKRVRLALVETTVPAGRRDGVEATRADGSKVYPWRHAAIVGLDDDGATPLAPMSAADLGSVGLDDARLLAEARDLKVRPDLASFGTDEGSQMRRLVYLRVLRALMA